MQNGNLHVVEKIRFDFDNSANGIYRDILYKYSYSGQKNDMSASSSRYQASNVFNIVVSETDSSYNEVNNFKNIEEIDAINGRKDVFSISNSLNDGYQKRIKIYTPSSSGEKKYLKIEYDVEDVAVLYQDKGEIYWNFVGSGWDNCISNLKININFEGSSNTPIKFYPHGYTKIEKISNFSEKLSFEVLKLSPKTAVDARIVFSNEYLHSSLIRKKVDENYNFNELEKIEKSMNVGKIRKNISNIVSYFIIAMTVIYLIILFIKSNKIASKGKVKKPNYYTHPLENLNLSVYTRLNGSVLSNTNLLMATILDLQQKKVLDMKARKKRKKFFDVVKYNYYFTINENADLTKLNEYERVVLNYLFNGYPKVEITDFKKSKIELNKRFEELSSNFWIINGFNSVCSKYGKKIRDVLFEKPDKGLKKFAFIGFMIIASISVINIFVISPLSLNIKVENYMTYLLYGIILFFLVIKLAYARSIKEEYYDEYNKLKGLERYLKDYSLIKDRYPIEIALWDRYLVFATFFGMAKKVAKEFKEELTKNGYSDDKIYNRYPVLCMSMYSKQISSSATSLTGSSSSGGYSGGGSGGGGGRRRRRWFFLGVLWNIYKI